MPATLIVFISGCLLADGLNQMLASTHPSVGVDRRPTCLFVSHKQWVIDGRWLRAFGCFLRSARPAYDPALRRTPPFTLRAAHCARWSSPARAARHAGPIGVRAPQTRAQVDQPAPPNAARAPHSTMTNGAGARQTDRHRRPVQARRDETRTGGAASALRTLGPAGPCNTQKGLTLHTHTPPPLRFPSLHDILTNTMPSVGRTVETLAQERANPPFDVRKVSGAEGGGDCTACAGG